MGFFDSVKNVVKEASEEAREKIKSNALKTMEYLVLAA